MGGLKGGRKMLEVAAEHADVLHLASRAIPDEVSRITGLFDDILRSKRTISNVSCIQF